MAPVTRRVAAVVASVLVILALAACGGGGTSTKDKNAYAQKVNDAQTTFASTVTTVDAESGTQNSLAHQRATLRRFKRAIDGVVSDLRKIAAPSEVTNEHKRLITVMSNFGKDIGQANDALSNPTPAAITEAKRRVALVTQSVNARVNAAIAAINAKLHGK
jgi:hypothetical protein